MGPHRDTHIYMQLFKEGGEDVESQEGMHAHTNGCIHCSQGVGPYEV